MAFRLVSGSTIGYYRIDEYVRTGGEGDLYSAVRVDGRRVALKQLKFSVSDPRNAELVNRALRLKGLIGMHSPFVCETYDMFTHDDLLYDVMEWVEGRSLDTILAERGSLSTDWLVPILGNVFEGLAWLHSHDIIHRDIKPANIIAIDGTGGSQAKLVDLGIFLDRRLPRVTCADGFVGTLEYVAPEMLLGVDGEVDARTDLYCVGVTLFELLTGKLPFPESRIPISRTFIDSVLAPIRPSMRAHTKTIPDSIDRYVQRLMSVNPDDRPSSAEEAWEELQRAVSEIVRPEDVVVSVTATTGTSVTSGVSLRVGNISIECGPLAGNAIAVSKKGITLGRAALNPDDSSISRFHICVKPRKRGLVVRDLGSMNGLIYRGKRTRRVLLPPGESVLIGETEIRFND